MALPEPPAAPSVAAVEGFDVRLAALLDAAPDALVCVEPGGRIAQVNQQVGQLFGSDDELLGAEVEILLPEPCAAGTSRTVPGSARTPRCGRWGRAWRWSRGGAKGRSSPSR
jgi:PAS domain-containing protein